MGRFYGEEGGYIEIGMIFALTNIRTIITIVVN
jgi:hypothetical protein